MSSDALKNEFLVESFENLSRIDEELTKLEKDPKNSEILNSVYRTVHTMKGSASFLGYSQLQDLTHTAENLLDIIREGNMGLTSGIIDILLQTFDTSQKILQNIESDGSEGNVDIAPAKALLEKAMNGDAFEGVVETKESVEDGSAEEAASSDDGLSAAALESLQEMVASGSLDASVIDEVQSAPAQASSSASDEVSEIETAEEFESLDEFFEEDLVAADIADADTEVNEMSAEEHVATSEQKPAAIEESSDELPTSTSSAVADSFVRVNVSVLDKIMNVVGELVLNRNQFIQKSSKIDDAEVTKLAHQLDTITSELQTEVMATRMQPVGNVLSKFERIVRDISRQYGKQIHLSLVGQETELDRTLLEAIKDPLVHIIRNSCDHGIEDVAQREAVGKPTQGTIQVRAFNESGQVTIEISDDGKGIDVKKIKEKALEKNLITPEQSEKMTESQLFQLIFSPGFSTADKVTNISGRGVGMDVVKTNIERIGGSVTMQSKVGEGTVFKLKIPLTLAIVGALMVKSHNEVFAIPQLNLVELVRLESEKELKQIESIQGSKFLRLRGNLTPLFNLEELLHLGDIHELSKKLNSQVEGFQFNTSEFVDNTGSYNIAILNAENNYFGIIVDEILDTEEIVVKPIGNKLKEIGVYGGATILGDGRVALIVDAVGFLNNFANADTSNTQRRNDEDELNPIEEGLELQENILFKLSDERTYAVPLTMVSRLEEFKMEDIEMTGTQPVIRYLDRPMPILNIESLLKLSEDQPLDSYAHDGIIQCVVINMRDRFYALVVSSILDISINRVRLDSSVVDREGIMGTIFINDEIINLLDIFKIIDSLNLGKALDSGEPKEFNELLKEKTVLLVDDSLVYRKMEGDVLHRMGLNVIYAKHGQEALDLLLVNNVDLLITDIEMPIMDGFNLSQKVKEMDKFKDLPIIAISTRVTKADLDKGKDSGFDHHLEKFNRDQVIELVNNILLQKQG